MITRFFTVPCTITTPSSDTADSTTDEEGVPIVESDEHETLCHLQPYRPKVDEVVLGSEEARRARRIWLPQGTDIRFTSTVTVGLDSFTVAGDPDTWNVGSTNDHISALLVRTLAPGESSGESA